MPTIRFGRSGDGAVDHQPALWLPKVKRRLDSDNVFLGDTAIGQ
jgi:hypothetical protein